VSYTDEQVREASSVLRAVLADREFAPSQWSSAVRTVSGFRCEGPGPHSGRLEAYPEDGDRSNTTIQNGRCLCRGCHSAEQPPAPPSGPEQLRDRDTLAQYVSRGYTLKDIATELGVSYYRVRSSFKKLGLSTPQEIDRAHSDHMRQVYGNGWKSLLTAER